MKAREKNSQISVQIIAGAYNVLLGLNATKAGRKGLLGFAIHRTDHNANEQYWLRGLRTFKETYPSPAPGSLVSTQEHPVQDFHWGDYTAKPDTRYIYKIVPMYGNPNNLQPGQAIEIEITTENEGEGEHAIYFNRGVAGSQAYARKFQNREPDKVPNREAYIWLSRGLEEAMLAFIGQAQDPSYSLRAAVYEFSYQPVLAAFGEAAKNCQDVKIIYDARPGKDHPVTTSDKNIDQANIRSLMIKRTKNPNYISHNKFIILLKNSKPIQVWTGSTNFTEGGIFGQSNVGHIVRDPEVAQAYLDYWERLSTDPEMKALRAANLAATPNPAGPPPDKVMPIFSPRPDLGILNWYADVMSKAEKTVCFTAAFGVNKVLANIFEVDPGYLRYILLEKPGNTFRQLVNDKDNLIAIGDFIQGSKLHGWLQERLSGLNKNVRYLHTKYMLIDPLSENPLVISGSANFSDNSTKSNDENMLVIRGDTRVADIYLGEFMRLFYHFLTRDIANRLAAEPGSEQHDSAYLAPDDSWTGPFYQDGSAKYKQRELFA